MAVVLRCGKQMGKLPHYHFSWIVSFQKQRSHICELSDYPKYNAEDKSFESSELYIFSLIFSLNYKPIHVMLDKNFEASYLETTYTSYCLSKLFPYFKVTHCYNSKVKVNILCYTLLKMAC